METNLARTKAQLKVLGYPMIGIQLKDGSKHIGRVTKFTPYKIFFRDKNGDELDVPRRIIARALLLIQGDVKNDRPAPVHRPY